MRQRNFAEPSRPSKAPVTLQKTGYIIREGPLCNRQPEREYARNPDASEGPGLSERRRRRTFVSTITTQNQPRWPRAPPALDLPFGLPDPRCSDVALFPGEGSLPRKGGSNCLRSVRGWFLLGFAKRHDGGRVLPEANFGVERGRLASVRPALFEAVSSMPRVQCCMDLVLMDCDSHRLG